MYIYEVEYLTNAYDKVTVEIEAENENEAIEKAVDMAYAGLCVDDWWRQLIDVNLLRKV